MNMIESEKARQLLTQDEGPALEFKSEMYRLFDDNGVIKSRHRDEFIKDVLSLANGSSSTVGETAYLVIGASDDRDLDGDRTIFDIQGKLPSADDARKIVNAACAPPIEQIFCESVEVDGKHLFVISVPPSLQVHETIRELKAKSTEYSKHVVFTRHNGSIEIASAKDREAIAHMKRTYFTKTTSVPPAKSGALLGAALLGWAAASMNKEKYGTREAQIGGGIGGIIAGGLIGGMTGWLYRNFVEIRIDWPTMPNYLRAFVVAIPIGSVLVTRVLNNRFKKKI